MATIANVFTNFSESSKTKEWFMQLLNECRNKKQFLISKERYQKNESFYTATYDISNTKRKYDVFNVPIDELFIDFQQLDIFSSRANSIVSIIEKMGMQVKANTLDPTAKGKRDEDISLLKAEAMLTPIRKQMANAIGLQKPLPIASPEDFSSDISPIAKNGLDINNPIDEGIFKDYLQRQIWEIALEIGAQHYLNVGEYVQKEKQILLDLINSNVGSAFVNTNSYSGEPELLYLYPFNTYTVLSRSVDGKDALGKGWEQQLSVRKIIGIMGKDIKMEDLLELLKLAAPMGGNTNYDGIWMYGSGQDPTSGFGYPYGTERSRCCDWQKFLNLEVTIGYFEVKSQNSDVYVHSMDNGNPLITKENYDYNVPKQATKVDSAEKVKSDKDQFLEYKFYDVTYRGYYIPSSNIVFGFGKLPLQVRYGSTNELTDFSIVTQKIRGKSMNEKCQPFIKHIFDLWCKMQFFINRSRPSGEMWNIETVRQMAKDIIGTDGHQGKTIDTLKVLESMLSGIYVPQTVNGEQTGGDAMPVKWQTRGLDPTTIDIYNFIQRDKNSIVEITGVSDVLLATQPTSQDQGLGVSQIALQQSLNTIYYLQSSVQKLFSDIAFNLCYKVQLIVNGSVSDEAYVSLEKAIGKRNVQAIKSLGDDLPKAFGISISFGMDELQRQQLDQLCNLLVQSKAITAAQAVSIKKINNYEIAAALLGVYEAKNMQAQQQSAMASIQAESQKSAQEHAQEMKELELKNKGMLDVANANGEWNFAIKTGEFATKKDLQKMKDMTKLISQDAKHTQDLQKSLTQDQLANQQMEAEHQHEKEMQNTDLQHQKELAQQQPQTAE